MSSAINKIAAATAVTLIAGLGLAGSAGSASADEFGFCEGTTAPENTDPANQAPVANDDTASTAAGLTLTLKVLANDSDPDGDKLYVASTTSPKRGDACLEKNGTITYTAAMRRVDYTDTFTYGVTDGDRYRTAKVTVRVAGVRAMRADLRQHLALKKHSHKVKHPARIAFRNPNKRRMLLVAGDPKKDSFSIQRFVEPKSTTVVVTKHRRLAYLVILAPRSVDDFALVDIGLLNTKTGRHQLEYMGDDQGEFGFSGSSSSRSTMTARYWAHRLR